MTQTERIAELNKVRAEMDRLKALSEAVEKSLKEAHQRFQALRKECEHRDDNGKSTWKGLAMFGSECTICGETDF